MMTGVLGVASCGAQHVSPESSAFPINSRKESFPGGLND